MYDVNKYNDRNMNNEVNNCTVKMASPSQNKVAKLDMGHTIKCAQSVYIIAGLRYQF